MKIFDHIDRTKLERRDAQLWMLAITMLVIFAVGIALLIYPAAFTMPVVLSGYLVKRIYFSFCVLALLVVGYLMERRIEIGRLRTQLKEEESRRNRLLNEASADLLASLPGLEHFRDRLAMEFRRAANAELPLSLVLVNVSPGESLTDTGDITKAFGDAAKAMLRKLRGEDSIYLFHPGVFGVVLPGVPASTARRVEERLSEGLAEVSGAGFRFNAQLQAISYPDDVSTAHQMERAAKMFNRNEQTERAAA
jgi:GGDEF domain-containing protein